MSLRVLHLIPSLGPGGAERQLTLLAPAMSSASLDCHISFGQPGPNLARLTGSGVGLHMLPPRSNHDPRILADLLALVRRLKPDLVQTWLGQMDILGGVAARILSVPHVLSERSSSSAYPEHWKSRLRLLIGKNVAAIVANSKGGVAYWNANGTRSPLFLVRNAIARTQSPPLDSNPSEVEKIIIFAGRLSNEKNVLRLLDSLVQVCNLRHEVNVKMFGDGPLREVLKKGIERSNVSEKFELVGYSESLAASMVSAHMCVSVSHFEGNPNVVIEAASLGCPLVLSNIPAHREILKYDAAWFVDGNSQQSITKGILAALDNPSRSRAQATRASLSLSEFTVDYAVQAYKDIYSQVLRC